MRNKLQAIKKIVSNYSKVNFLVKKEQLLAEMESNLITIDNEITLLETKACENQQSIEKFKKNIRRLKDNQEELEETLEDTESELKKTKKNLTEKVAECSTLENNLRSQEVYFKQQIEQRQKEIQSLELRRQIIGKLVSTHNTCDKFKAFSDELHNNFIEFISRVSSLPQEAKVLLELQKIEQELKLISAFPEFHTKRTIAVGGGFSAGKSEFISSLFKDDSVKLPSDIDATTAIPTYVLGCGNNDEIINNLIGINIQGGTVNLSKINPNIHKELTHQFMNSFSFPLKTIMPYMFLPTPLAYKNLCFIDTPGYNPASGKGTSTASDTEIAKDYLSNAEALIWLIGADANGTIPQTDIAFLKEIKKEELANNPKPLYVIYNKADLKSDKDINSVIAGIKTILNENNIEFVGISAYSSVNKKEYQFENISLFYFIDSVNNPSNKHNTIAQKIYAIDEMYQYAIKKEQKETKMYSQSLYDIAYKLQVDNYAKGDNIVYGVLDTIEGRFTKDLQQLEKHLENLDKAINALISRADDIFNCKSTVRRPVIDIESVEVNEVESIDFEEDRKVFL